MNLVWTGPLSPSEGLRGEHGSAVALPDCWPCSAYVLPMYPEVDPIHLGIHRQYSRGDKGDERC